MSSKRYPEEFKIEAMKQITENRYPIAEVLPVSRRVRDAAFYEAGKCLVNRGRFTYGWI